MANKKIALVVKAIVEAKQITPKDKGITVYISAENRLDSILPQELKNILWTLQDEEVLRLWSFPDWLLPSVEFTEELLLQQVDAALDPQEKSFVVTTVLPDFDNWCKSYLYQVEKYGESLPVTQTVREKLAFRPDETVCFITFTGKREIVLNHLYRIAKPDFDSENENVFSFLYDHPNIKYSKEQIEQEKGIKIHKEFDKILENLGFKGNLRKLFFDVSTKSIKFYNPIKQARLDEIGLSGIRLPQMYPYPW